MFCRSLATSGVKPVMVVAVEEKGYNCIYSNCDQDVPPTIVRLFAKAMLLWPPPSHNQRRVASADEIHTHGSSAGLRVSLSHR